MTYKARLEVVSDVVCPWCYIGKRRLERAIKMVGDELELTVQWAPYELNPTMPKAGMARRDYCEAKFGSVEYANQLYANVAANAAADGLPMAIERIARTPNTRRAHALIEHAASAGKQDAVVDALFAAYFVEGRDVGATAILLEIAESTGLERESTERALSAPGVEQAIETRERAAQDAGINGVPAFLFNGRLLFSGAQTPETMSLAFKRAAARGL